MYLGHSELGRWICLRTLAGICIARWDLTNALKPLTTRDPAPMVRSLAIGFGRDVPTWLE